MIFSTEKDQFPNKDQYEECTSYLDENEFEWKIAVTKKGFYLAYFGDSYFQDTNFSLEIKGKHMLVRNTGCFFFDTKDHDTFYRIRLVVVNGFTDDIWETIGELLEERLMHDPGIMECERTNT